MPARKGENRFTIVVVPHNTREVKRYQLQKWWIKALAALLAVTVCTAGYIYWDYSRLRTHVPELERLEAEKERQEERLEALARKAEELDAQAEELEQLEQQVRVLMEEEEPMGSGDWEEKIEESVEDEASESEALVGGFDSWSQVSARFAAVEDLLEDSREDLVALREELEERVEYQEARPQGWPTSGRITSTYGYRSSPFGGGRQYHEGLDIAGPTGTEIRVTAPGEVIFAGYRSGYGRTVIVEHGFGYRTLYAHNSSLEVEVGDQVKEGQVIALMGSTGASTGPHLHYEVHRQGQPVDPEEFL